MTKQDAFFHTVSAFSKDRAVASKYAALLEDLFEVLIPEAIGSDFCHALQSGDYISALKICATYYRSKADNVLPELSAKGGYDLQNAEDYLLGKVRSVNIDWKFPGGEIDFLFDPTAIKGPINHEWLWQFNRHNEWATLARAYVATGDEKYARFFQKQLLKWIAQTDLPEVWNAPGSAWRTIECGLRLLGSWQIAFDGFKHSPSLSDAALLLMIASMHKQAVHLVAHPMRKNWLMMESNGVYTFSALFFELSDAKKHKEIATQRLLREMRGQILPDGMHNELSPDYQTVVFSCAANFYNLSKSLGESKENLLELEALMRHTVNAAMLLSTPAMTQPRTNDCFTISTNRFTARAASLLGETEEYKFFNTQRAQGTPPKGKTASAFLPYAGFAVMRSDWSADATYLCFDVGPLGVTLTHQDKLNLILFRGDEELIYDDGGGQYELSPARDYARSGFGHNTVLVDGMAQNRKAPLVAEQPVDADWITNDIFDYASATYDDTFGEAMEKPATHKREVRFCKPDLFVISDTLTSVDGNKHDYEVLFHLDTTRVSKIPQYQNAILSDFGRKYELALIPLDEENAPVELKTVSAVTEPQMQGWYNGRNDADLHKAITVSRRVCGVANFQFHTLLIPIRSGDPLPLVEQKEDGSFRVLLNDREHCFFLK